MWSSEVTNMILVGIWETLYMTLVSTFAGYVIGLPMGIVLTVTDKDGIHPNGLIYKILDVIANVVRSIPFIILLVLLIPFTRLIVGKSYGSTATIVPLVIAAAPYIARMVESSLKEVDAGVIEAASIQFYDHYKSHVSGSKNLSFSRSDHYTWNDFRLFCNVRSSWRRRIRSDRDPLRIYEMADRHYDRHSCIAGNLISDFPDDRYETGRSF